MAELIDISNEKFWDILFDEACVEGQQAERIEKELKTISTTEAEIRAKAINEFFDELQKYEEDDWLKLKMLSIYHIAEQLKERE